jgi:hypothetical protein
VAAVLQQDAAHLEHGPRVVVDVEVVGRHRSAQSFSRTMSE